MNLDRARFHGPPRLDQVPPPPRRPSPLARRLVFAYQGTQAALRVAGIVFTVAGLALLVPLGWNLPVDAAVAVGGAEVTGVVRSVERARRERILGQRPWYVAYAYEVDGLPLDGEATVLVEPPPAGAPIELEVVPSRPRWSRVAGRTRNVFGWGWGLAPLLLVALGVSGLAKAIGSNRREVRAFVHGRPVLARVTFRGQDPTVELNRRHPFVVRWEFQAPTGERVEGSLSSMEAADLQPFEGAEQVVVLYDPADPRCNTLYVA